MLKYFFLSLFILAIPLLGNAQEIEKPNFALASHPMSVKTIYKLENKTIVVLSIENKSETGFFCADESISLVNSTTGTEFLLQKSEGIPVCPENYQFHYVGEVLTFRLFFPKLDSLVKYVDIIENCSNNCFSIKGVILDKSINKNIDLGYAYYRKSELDLALQAFKKAVNANKNYPYGWIHYNILQIYKEKNNAAEVQKWKNLIVRSNFMDKKHLMEKIKQYTQ